MLMFRLAFAAICTLHIPPAQANELPKDDDIYLSLLGFPDCFLEEVTLPGTAAVRCQQRAANALSIKVACVGDSITAGYHASNGKATYPAQLQRLLDARTPGGYEVTNLGATGATLQREGDSPYWRRPQFQALIQNKWDVVIIMLGTNDAKDEGDDGPPNWHADCETLEDCFFAAEYKALIEVVRALGPGSKPPKILPMVPPPLIQAKAIGANQTVINDVYPKLVPLITHVAAVKGPIDIFRALGGVSDWRKMFSAGGCGPGMEDWKLCEWYCFDSLTNCDQCHPSDRGYALMAQTVIDQADGVLTSPPAQNNKLASQHLTSTTTEANYDVIESNVIGLE